MPNIGLIGAGHFGRQHLFELERLQKEGRLHIAGIVVSSERSKQLLESITQLPVMISLEDSFLQQLDAVDIVTPSDSHFSLIQRCLQHCHVLVEKPMSMTLDQAHRLIAATSSCKQQLMVGHNYRFNPVISKLKSFIADNAGLPHLVEITMLNLSKPGVEELNPNLEFIHAFDIMDFIFGLKPEVLSGKQKGTMHEISIRYGQSLHSFIQIGWCDKPATRKITISYPEQIIICDLINNTIFTKKGHKVNKLNLPHESVSLRNELIQFLDLISGSIDNPVSASVATRSIEVATQTMPVPLTSRPKVAVIGGGVFGTNCALELSDSCEVTLFERHENFMEEVSFVNQWRHHSGFHYPRSYDTIQEIKATKSEFEALYNNAIVRGYPSYFCPSAYGVEIPAERYVAACSSNYLSFTFENPPKHIVDQNSIALSLKSDEAVYDFYLLRQMIADRLEASPHISVRLKSEVIDGHLLTDGNKYLTIRGPAGTYQSKFDYLINATYSNRNLLAKWFSFPVEPLRFDLYELLVLRLPIDQICVTILDGPFTSLVGMGHDNLFMLSHIHDSVSKSEIPEDGMPPNWGDIQSNRENMLRSASRYMPILAQAEVVESRYATRAVNAFAKDFDARPTVIRNHGFGCWSVLGGKVITCVSNAKEITSAIEQELKTSTMVKSQGPATA